MLWFRVVILQDAAVLYSRYPHLSIFAYKPFNSQAFRNFAASSTAVIAHAESKARLAYENMPKHLVASLRGTYADLRLEQRKEQEKNSRMLESLDQRYSDLEGLIKQFMEVTSSTSRRGKNSKLSCCDYVSLF
jgi:hypothetical protein